MRTRARTRADALTASSDAPAPPSSKSDRHEKREYLLTDLPPDCFEKVISHVDSTSVTGYYGYLCVRATLAAVCRTLHQREQGDEQRVLRHAHTQMLVARVKQSITEDGADWPDEVWMEFCFSGWYGRDGVLQLVPVIVKPIDPDVADPSRNSKLRLDTKDLRLTLVEMAWHLRTATAANDALARQETAIALGGAPQGAFVKIPVDEHMAQARALLTLSMLGLNAVRYFDPVAFMEKLLDPMYLDEEEQIVGRLEDYHSDRDEWLSDFANDTSFTCLTGVRQKNLDCGWPTHVGLRLHLLGTLAPLLSEEQVDLLTNKALTYMDPAQQEDDDGFSGRLAVLALIQLRKRASVCTPSVLLFLLGADYEDEGGPLSPHRTFHGLLATRFLAATESTTHLNICLRGMVADTMDISVEAARALRMLAPLLKSDEHNRMVNEVARIAEQDTEEQYHQGAVSLMKDLISDLKKKNFFHELKDNARKKAFSRLGEEDAARIKAVGFFV